MPYQTAEAQGVGDRLAKRYASGGQLGGVGGWGRRRAVQANGSDGWACGRARCAGWVDFYQSSPPKFGKFRKPEASPWDKIQDVQEIRKSRSKRRFRKSRTDIEDPKRARPESDTLLPSLANDLSDSELPT